ncbi:MAG TPA: gamma-glutamyltransferase, partial [Polyangiaceae bacterium]
MNSSEGPLSFDMPYGSERALAFGTSAVASSHAHASQVALRVLQDGGNAVDAAIAAAATLTVVEPTMNGLGGDLFALVWDGERLHGLNASGRSPRAWSLERFAGLTSMPELGWDAVTVPGAVSGWALLQERFATRSLADLVAPAVSYANDGFIVTPKVATLWAEAAARFGEFAEFRRVFLPNGAAPAAGSLFKLPDAADTLCDIGESAGESFYRGALAKRIAASARAQGGVLDEEDLALHRANWELPLAAEYAGVCLHELPPNGQGLASLLALSILSELRLERFGPDDADSIHLQIE